MGPPSYMRSVVHDRNVVMQRIPVQQHSHCFLYEHVLKDVMVPWRRPPYRDRALAFPRPLLHSRCMYEFKKGYPRWRYVQLRLATTTPHMNTVREETPGGKLSRCPTSKQRQSADCVASDAWNEASFRRYLRRTRTSQSPLFKYVETIPITYLDENLAVKGQVTVLKPVFIAVNTAQNYMCIRPPVWSVHDRSVPQHILNFVFSPPPSLALQPLLGPGLTQKMPPFFPIPTCLLHPRTRRTCNALLQRPPISFLVFPVILWDFPSTILGPFLPCWHDPSILVFKFLYHPRYFDSCKDY